MLAINYKQIYETGEFGEKQWILILYDISANHYVGVPVYSNENDGCFYLESIDKYININKIGDYNRSKMIRCIYKKGRPLKLSNEEFNKLIEACKESLVLFFEIIYLVILMVLVILNGVGINII